MSKRTKVAHSSANETSSSTDAHPKSIVATEKHKETTEKQMETWLKLLAKVTFWIPLVVGILFAWPLSEPYIKHPLSESIVFLWKHKAVPILLGILAILPGLVLALRGGLSRFERGKLCCGWSIWLGSVVYACVIVPMHSLNYIGPQPHFQNCLIDCETPWQFCVVPKALLHQQSNEPNQTASRQAAAIAEWRHRLVGWPLVAINVVLDVTGLSADIRVGTVTLTIPIHDQGTGDQGALITVHSTILKYSKGVSSRFRYRVNVPSNGLDPKEPPGAWGPWAGDLFAVQSVIVEQLAELLRAQMDVPVSVMGCSTYARVAMWTAATAANPSLFKNVFLDAAGTMGFASIRHVGYCGEPVHSFVRRFPGWFSPNATEEDARLPFEYDVADIIGDRCHSTLIVASLAYRSQVENLAGSERTISLLQRRGCHVEVVPQKSSHTCGDISA